MSSFLLPNNTDRQMITLIILESSIPLQVPVAWRFDSADSRLNNALSFYPPCGLLLPLCADSVVVTFIPPAAGIYRFPLRCIVGGGAPVYIGALADVQLPKLCASPAIIDMGIVYRGVSSRAILRLTNPGRLPASFIVKNVEDLKNAGLLISPSAGSVPSESACELAVDITGGNSAAVNTDIVIDVDDMPGGGLVVGVAAVVQGLNVLVTEMESMHEPSNAKLSVVGEGDVAEDANKDGSKKRLELLTFEGRVRTAISRRVLLHNLTAIHTVVDVSAEVFAAESRESALARGAEGAYSSVSNAVLGKGIPDDQSLTKTARSKVIRLGGAPSLGLQSSIPAGGLARTAVAGKLVHKPTTVKVAMQDCAFVVEPREVELGPFACVPVTVTVFGNVWGCYSDRINVIAKNSADLKTTADSSSTPVCSKLASFFVSARLAGCPLEAQLMAGSVAAPMLHLPAGGVGAERPVERTLIVRNTSAHQVSVDWTSYVIKSNDTQLLDVLGDVDALGNIRLRSRIHEGTMSATPFSVIPSKARLEGGARMNFVVQFSPIKVGVNYGFLRGNVKISEPSSPESRPSFTSASISTDHAAADVENASGSSSERSLGLVTRAEFTEEETALQVFTEAAAVKPELDLVVLENEPAEVLFESDLHTVLQSPVKVKRVAVLTNHTQATLHFALGVEGPFAIVGSDPPPQLPGALNTTSATISSHGPGVRIDSSSNSALASPPTYTPPASQTLTRTQAAGLTEASAGIIALAPSHKVHVTLHGLLNRKMVEYPFPGPSCAFSGSLVASFGPESIQRFTLRSVLNAGVLHVSQNTVDFGACFVGSAYTVNIVLTNLGRSPCVWSADANAPFQCIPAAGMLEGNTSRIAECR